jgi:hypothetical protein
MRIHPEEGWGVGHWSAPAPCSQQLRGSRPTDKRVANGQSTTGLRRRQAGCNEVAAATQSFRITRGQRTSQGAHRGEGLKRGCTSPGEAKRSQQ